MTHHHMILTSGAGGSDVPRPDPNTSPSLSRPTIDRRVFIVDGQAWRWKGVTAFQLLDLFSQGRDISAFVRLYLGLGFNTFRVLVNKPAFAPYPGWSTPPLGVALAFLRYMASEGARVEMTLFGSRVDAGFVPSWIDAFRDQAPNVFVEGVNEPGHENQYPTTAEIDALVLPHRGDLPYATGNYDTSQPMRGSYGTIHTDRAGDPYETARKAKAVLEMYDGWDGYVGSRVPWVNDEPDKVQGMGLVPYAITALFGISSLFGAGATAHSISGQFGQLPTDDEYAYAQAAILGLNAFPADVANLGHYVHDTADEGTTGSLRTYRVSGTPYGVRVRPSAGYPTLIGV